VSDLPAAISIRSLHRRIDLATPLDADDETAWLLLLIPVGATDVQVIQWAAETLPPAAVEELAERIALEAEGGDAP
jgi:hypothetical protein